jgi:predicted transcriptional regulator
MNNDKKLAKEERLFREEMWLRSAVNSAGIEGNTLTVLKYKLLTLPLRRRKIYDLIKKHPYSSFNYISGKFSKVNPKTLHYDLKKLQEKWLIIKIGETRGVTYKIGYD